MPEKGQKSYWDDSLPGFAVRVSQGGSRSYIVMYGKSRRLKTLGRHPALSLADARKHAKRILAYQNPNNLSLGYSEAVESYLDECMSRVRPNTLREYKRYLNSLDYQGNVDAVTRQHLTSYLTQPHALVAFKVFFNWCLKNDLIDRNPVMGEKVVYNQSRSRVLSPDELKAIWTYNYPPFSDIVKLLILTGQRRTEIGSMKGEWITDVITFPSSITKNKQEHTIPYGELTAQYLKPFSLSGWSKAKARLDKNVDLPHWTLHDLRRTFSTIHAQIGTPIHVTEKLLNHVSGTQSGVVAIYNRHTYMAEMKQAVVTYEAHISKIVSV